MKTYIYALLCPIEQTIKYIGKANDPYRRLRDHLQDIRGITIDKLLWIDKLKRAKLKPILEILDEVEIEKWQFWESWYMEYYKSIGLSLISKRAGNGLTFSNNQTFKKGQIPYNYNKKLINGKYV